MSDSRDSNHDGRVSFIEKIKDKLHLGHKDKDAESVRYHTATTTYPGCAACQAALTPPGQVYQPGLLPGQFHQPAVVLPTASAGTYPAYVPCDETCGHISAAERATGAVGGHRSSRDDSRDLNRDGYISTEEKFAGSAGAYGSGAYDTRDLNRDGHVLAGEKFAGAIGSSGAYDSRDRNHDGHVSMGEKFAAGTGHIGRPQASDETRLTLHEERLVVVKGEVSAGEVGIRKHVQEELVQQSVPVMREEIVVERRALSGAISSNSRVAEPDEISRVTLYREELVRHRRLVPTEEVIVRKKIVTDHETVSGNLRSEYFEAKQVAATSGPRVAGGDYDARDANRDGHVSAGENLEAAVGTSFRTVGNETRIKLHEEQLAVSKREISAGGVDVHKRVREEHVQQSVPVKREELVVERRPLTGTADAKPGVATPDEIMRFTLYREEIVIEKCRVPSEEVIVRRKFVTEDEIVNETLRSEHIEIQQLGATAASVGGAYEARDANRDGHVSTGEKLKTATGTYNEARSYDTPDTNRDGYASTGEKLKAGNAAGSYDTRDVNRDGYVSAGEKVQAAVGTNAPAARG